MPCPAHSIIKDSITTDSGGHLYDVCPQNMRHKIVWSLQPAVCYSSQMTRVHAEYNNKCDCFTS